MNALRPAALAALTLFLNTTYAQSTATAAATPSINTLESIQVQSSADASAEGLSPAYAGGQVARGSRAGILGTRDFMDTPFSITSYTNELIQDSQARSVGDVLQNDPGVRVARGYGNFQESYFIRGFPLESDSIAYNGLYGVLPRQYIESSLFERVELLRGASAFLNGATPSGQGIGGALNLLPKRASNEPLTRLTAGLSSGGQGLLSLDMGRRIGEDERLGVRLNAVRRGGGSGVHDENSELSLVSLGMDWRGDRLRLSGDIGWQENRLKRTRPSVTLAPGAEVPDAPDARTNFAQPWTYSNERDLFGTLRAEYDVTDRVTAWAAYGMRRSHEANSLAGVKLSNGVTGDGTYSRFDNRRDDAINTGEIGLRGKLRTGAIGHEWVVSAAIYQSWEKGAWAMGGGGATNIYSPSFGSMPGLTGFGGELTAPRLVGRKRLSSFAVGDTISMFDERFLITLGVRHQRLSDQSFDYSTGVEKPSYNESRVSPSVGLVFKMTPEWSVYANYIEALGSGGRVGEDKALNYGQILKPYVSKQKEAGIKYDGGRLGASLAFFTTDKPRGVLGADKIFSQSGEDRHRGLELTAFGELHRGLRLLGGATWLDARQISTGSDTTEGKRTIGVPRMQANMGVEWDIPGVQGLTVDSRLIYTGASYADAVNTQKIPGWTRLDAGMRYMWDIQGRLVTLRARVDNLTDRNYWASVGGYPGSGYLTLGSGRTYSLNASFEF